MKSNIQLKYSNYVAFSHIRGKVVNNSGLIYKIQELISTPDFINVKDENLILHRSIANKIEFLENNTEDNLKEDVKKLKETFASYREFYGNHYTDAEYMEKSKVELMNYIKLIDDTCDKIHMKLL